MTCDCKCVFKLFSCYFKLINFITVSFLMLNISDTYLSKRKFGLYEVTLIVKLCNDEKNVRIT